VTKLWFMDVDGVIAPFGKGGAFRDWVRSPHPVYELWLSAKQAALIRRILLETDTQLIWVTTWADQVATYIEDVLGWPHHRFAPLPHPDLKGGDCGPTGRWWKLDAVEHVLDELRPSRFVWSDDDHPRHRSSVTQALQRHDAVPLLQAPSSYVGLSQRWLREAREHLEADPSS
jgi:hypothetical protein